MTLRTFLRTLWERHGLFMLSGVLAILTLWVVPAIANAATAPTSPNVPIPQINLGVGEAKNPRDVVNALQILLLLTVLALAPTLLVMVTSFTRIIVVLSFVRTALGTQQVPPSWIHPGGKGIRLRQVLMVPKGLGSPSWVRLGSSLPR